MRAQFNMDACVCCVMCAVCCVRLDRFSVHPPPPPLHPLPPPRFLPLRYVARLAARHSKKLTPARGPVKIN